MSNTRVSYSSYSNCLISPVPSYLSAQLFVLACVSEKLFPQNCGSDECSFEHDQRPIIIYFHGAVGDRGGYNRVCFYRILSESQLDAHVIVPDYRGFGDSKFDGKSYPSSIPSLETVISDIENTLRWVASKIPNPNRIVVWSHSLSTAFICRAVHQVGLDPGLLVLQAAVSDLRKAFHSHFLTQVYRRLPENIYRRITEGLHQNDLFHLSDPTEHIDRIRCRIIFIHSEEDKIVPYTLGLKLYMSTLASRTSVKPVPRMCIFSASEDLAFSHITNHGVSVRFLSDS
ncbi:lysophosphatidylserine lipase ABHD12-like [Brevipalpus obovatus]|uniref:lysophosphatidylserine lipase ABHD12-like n=1 Tax=Brevipalpus obovatus TaxID=246614 RepID=UPI003D9F3FD4